MRPRGPLRRGEAIRLVAGRELSQRLRARSYLVGSVAIVVLVLAAGVLTRVAGDDGRDPVELGHVGPLPAGFADTLDAAAAAAEREASLEEVADPAAALEDGEVDAVVDVGRGALVFEDEVDHELVAIVQRAWVASETRSALVEQGLSGEAVEAALRPAPLTTRSLDPDDDGDGLAVLTGTVVAVLLFISLQTFGTYVLTGVVEEKATAVVEVLLVRVRADQLLAGKVIGIGLAALSQFALAIGAGLVALAISDVDVPRGVWGALPMAVVWFLGGFALYATLFALAGSLVSRQEDAQAAAAPISYGLVIAYMVVFLFGYVPESTASRVLSVLPPITPFLMPMRMAAGAASVLEVALAVVLLALATVGAWKLGAAVYEQVLLQRGTRIGWRRAAELARRR